MFCGFLSASPSFWNTLSRFALSTSLGGTTGIRATVPLFIMSCMHEVCGFELSPATQFFDGWWVPPIIGVFLVVEVLADMIPCIDHALHAVMTFVHPVVGIVVALMPATSGAWEAVPFAAAGAVAALVTHTYKMAKRVASTSGTGGAGNCPVSISESIGSAVGSLLSIMFAFIALIGMLVVIAVGFLVAWRVKVQKERRAQRRSTQQAVDLERQSGRDPLVQAQPAVDVVLGGSDAVVQPTGHQGRPHTKSTNSGD